VTLGENMAKILAISDTHLSDGNLPWNLSDWVRKANLVLHAGDFFLQATYDALYKLCIDSRCELWAIQGNPATPQIPAILDKKGVKLPIKMAKEWNGIKIGLMHDANYSEYSNFSEASQNAATLDVDLEHSWDPRIVGADMLVFGHIHKPIIVWKQDIGSKKKRLLVCPGSASASKDDWRGAPFPTAAFLQIDNGTISSAEIIRLNPKMKR
jgi:putative phosphoesterase